MMNIILKISKNAILISGLLFSYAFDNPKIKKHDGGRCTGSKYCSACTNCSRCKHCGAGGVCGVCSPGSFEKTQKPAPPKKTVSKTKHDTIPGKRKK